MKLRMATALALATALAGAPASAQTGDDATWTLTKQAQLGEGDISLTGIASLPGGELVVVGSSANGRSALAWYSEDGRAWEPVKLPKAKNGVRTRVVGTATGAVAIATQQPNAGRPNGLIWTTLDGKEWSGPAQIKNAELGDIVATPDGVAILGAKARKLFYDPTVWRSSDGTSWEPTRIAKGNTFPRRLGVTPDGVWLATAIDANAGNYAMWRSSDGEVWEAVADHPLIDPDTSRKVALVEILGTDAGLVVAANWSDQNEDPTGYIWHSGTGADWTLVTESADPAGAAGVVSGVPVVIMQSLQPDGNASAFAASDGQAWTETPVTGMDGAAALLAPSPDGGVAVVGYSRLEEMTDDLGAYFARFDPAAWLGPSLPGSAAP